jgi:hypothetical protein
VPGSKVFLRIYFALGGVYFALGGILFLPLHALAVADEQSGHGRQCCQGDEISAAKHIDLYEEILCGAEFFSSFQNYLATLLLEHIAPRQVPPQWHKNFKF